MPQIMNFARGAESKAFRASNDASDASDSSSPYRRKPKPTKRITPDMRCNIEVYAGRGNLIVVISRLTGLLLFTLFAPTPVGVHSRISKNIQVLWTLRQASRGCHVQIKRVPLNLKLGSENLPLRPLNRSIYTLLYNYNCSLF